MTRPPKPAPLLPEQVESVLLAIEKSHQLGGNQPSPGALERARKVLTGELSRETARDEVIAKYRREPELPPYD